LHFGRAAIVALKRACGRLADIAMDLASKFSKLASDELGRAMLLEAKLGVCMQVLPPGGHFAVKQFDEMWNLRGEPLHDKRTNSTPRL
jgi:hypothetical protein